MKRKGNFFEKIISVENVKTAIQKASKGKKNRKPVKKILNDIDFYAVKISRMLEEKMYFPNKYIEMKIFDGVNKKERIICKSRFYPDSIIQWALMLQIEEILRKGAYEHSCACIKGKGIIHACNYIKKVLVQDRKNTKYCLKLDIKKFYPSIDKEILKQKFETKIKDRDVLNLIDLIIDTSESGLPIGNYTSQWFANFYLQDLDHYIKEKLHIKYYVRYMDDMILFHKNKKELHKIRKQIEEFLTIKEHLKLKENWQLFKLDSRPLDFVGYRFYRGYTTLRRGNFLRIKRRVKKIYNKNKMNYKDATAVISYSGWLKHCNSYNYRKKYVDSYVKLKKCKEVIKNENRE